MRSTSPEQALARLQAECAQLGNRLEEMYLDKLDGRVHAPAAMLATRRKGVSPFASTNDEEHVIGLAARARWLLDDELVKMGVHFTRGEIWKPYTVLDRNLHTGQNLASAAPLAQEVQKARN